MHSRQCDGSLWVLCELPGKATVDSVARLVANSAILISRIKKNDIKAQVVGVSSCMTHFATVTANNRASPYAVEL